MDSGDHFPSTFKQIQSNPIHFIYIARFKQTQGFQSAAEQDKNKVSNTTEAQHVQHLKHVNGFTSGLYIYRICLMSRT